MHPNESRGEFWEAETVVCRSGTEQGFQHISPLLIFPPCLESPEPLMHQDMSHCSYVKESLGTTKPSGAGTQVYGASKA